MVCWLLNEQHLILRIVGAAVASLLVTWLCCPWVIRFLSARKLGDRGEFDHPELNRLGRSWRATPTMGGVVIVGAILMSVLLFGNLGRMYVRMALLAAVLGKA